MKMADGGYRPAYNAGLATDTGSQVIVGLELTNAGSDTGRLTPMVRQIERRFERAPGAVLVDGGFVNLAEIEALGESACGTILYAPPTMGGRSHRLPRDRLSRRRPHLSGRTRRSRAEQDRSLGWSSLGLDHAETGQSADGGGAQSSAGSVGMDSVSQLCIPPR